MTKPLFPLAACSLSSIPAFDFEFNSACEVLPSPPAIFDQPDIEIPLDFPPQPVIIPPIAFPSISIPGPLPVCIPCPQFGASATMELVEDSVGDVQVAVTQIGSVGSCESSPECDFLFDFAFQIPLRPCPDISATATMLVPIESSGSSVGDEIVDVPVTVSKEAPDIPGGPCQYQFDFSFAALINIIANNVATIIIDGGAGCIPQMVFFTLTSDLPSGSSGTATSVDGSIIVQDTNAFIPAGKKIPSGTGGWAIRTCSGGGFDYQIVSANKCPTA